VRRAAVTVLKADISGSTALGERLDPEELRGVLGTYFTALAREIQRHGGAVDKYLGDAVMAVFGLPDASADDPARATSAALGMVEAIARENETLAKRYGVRLSLRVGVHSGELVAPEGAELTLMGDVVTLAESLEAAAPLNSVLVSEATRAAIGDPAAFEPGPAVKVKGHAGTIPSFHPIGSGASADVARGTARRGASASLQVAGQREDILQEERKLVTVLFADVLVQGRLTADATRPVLNAYFGDVAREIQRYGGTIDKYIGDAVMAVFGAPVAHEDDGARAISAGLGIQAALARRNTELERDHGVTLAARVGVNTGEVVAGMLAGEVVAYTVTGDAVNTAQRIESAAQPGELLVSEPTRDLARHAFVYEAVAPLTLKGKAQPVPAFRVVGREQRASAREGMPLVGRNEEMSFLKALLAEALAGKGRAVHVFGEPGVGKTRLIGELLTSMPREAARVRARSASYETETPYALVADVLRRLVGLQPADDETAGRAALAAALADMAEDERSVAVAVLLEALGHAAVSLLTPEAKRRLIVAQVRALLERLAGGGLAVVLEDVHWIDPVSADVLGQVVAAIPAFACLVISTSRGADVPWTAERMELQPLAETSATTMIDRLAPSLDERSRALVLERTAGNPFFIEEVVAAMAADRTATVPLTVQDLLESRLDALERQPRLVAQRASVIGRSFWTRVLARVTPDPEIDAPLATLEQERFVEPRERVPERTYVFRHALVQEVVYRTQLIAQRKRAHVSVGDAYGDLYGERLDDFVDVLAYHYGRGDDDPKALTWLSRAGDRARSLYANEEAIAYYRSALERAPDGEGPLEAGSLLERIGDVQLVVGRYDDAVATFDDARAHIARPARTTDARLHRKVAQVRRAQRAFDVALETFTRARDALGDEENAELAWIEFGVGRLHLLRGDYPSARAHTERGIRVAERIGDEMIVAEGLLQSGIAATRVGDAREAVRLYRGARDIYEKLEHLEAIGAVRINLGVALTRLARYEEARTELEGGLHIWRRIGNPLRVGDCWNDLGDVHRLAGRPLEAVTAYQSAIDTWSAIGQEEFVAVAMIGLGDALVRAGRPGEGKRELEEALRRYEALGTTPYHSELYRFLADAELALGHTDAAAAAADRAIEHARAKGARHHEASAQRVQARVALAHGDPTRARELLEASRATLEELGEAGELALTLELLAAT
jgi:class 3 adenylate cyclase/tetratricopeptide (TPR) repeat protein